MQSDKFYSLQTVDGLADTIGEYEFYFNDYKMFEKDINDLKNIKISDCVKAAKKYINSESFVLAYSGPDVEASLNKDLEKWANDLKECLEKAQLSNSKKNQPENRVKAKVKSDVSLLKTAKFPRQDFSSFPYKKYDLSNGSVLVIKQTKDSPVISMKLAYLGGLRYESDFAGGTSELASRLWSAGTSRLKESDIYEKTESLASYVDAFSGRNTTGLSLMSLAPYYDDVFSIFKDIFLNPSFPEDVLQREKLQVLEHIRGRKDRPAQKCMQEMNKLLFQNHPYSRELIGNENSIPKIDKNSIAEYFSTIRDNSRLVVSLVGHIDPDHCADKLTEMIDQYDARGVEAVRLENTKLDEDKSVFFELKKEQSHICIGYKGISFMNKRRYALDVLQAILAGQGGRLFMELRDKNSLAYTVAPLRMDGIENGYFGTYIACSPEKGKKSIELMLKELDRISHSKVSAEELDRAKNYLIGKHHIGLQKNSGICSQYLFNQLYGVPLDEVERYAELLSDVTPEAVLALAQDIFSQKKAMVSVGSSDPF